MSTILIVPGLHGSQPAHWQSWFEQQLPGCVRVNQCDWSEPDLPRWAVPVRDAVSQATGEVWIVAHSFGCLATVRGVQDCAERIAGAMLVAPADPDKFGVAAMLPDSPLHFPSVVAASTNDPWVRLMKAAYLAQRWGSDFINLGARGHVNVESGHGAWPRGLAIFKRLQRSQSALPRGQIEQNHPSTGCNLSFNRNNYSGEAR